MKRKNRDTPGRKIAQAIIAEYKPQSVGDGGMSQRSATIDDIYKLSAEQISKITDYVLEEQESWQNRTLAPFYPFLFVDCLFVLIKRDYETKECAVYNILGIRVDGRKEILGLWIQDSESKHARRVEKSRRTRSRLHLYGWSFGALGGSTVAYKDFTAHFPKSDKTRRV